MIKYCSLLILAVFLAQAFIAALAVYYVQLKNDKINYWQAVHQYFKSNVARYVLVAICVIIACFVLSEYLDLSLTRDDLKAKGVENLSRLEFIQFYFKSSAISLGAFIEIIAVIVYKAGFKSIIDFGKSKGLSDHEAKNI